MPGAPPQVIKDHISYPNGDFYEGETAGPPTDLVRHGFGFYRYTEQGCYEGEYVNDDKHGWGMVFGTNGAIYAGQWLTGRQHGRGVEVHYAKQTGLWIYDGEFRNGLRCGTGSMTVRGKRSVSGTWANGKVSNATEVDEDALACNSSVCAESWDELQTEIPGIKRLAISPAALIWQPDVAESTSRIGTWNGQSIELVRLVVDFPARIPQAQPNPQAQPGGAQQAQVEQLRQAGFSLEDIASILQCSVESLSSEEPAAPPENPWKVSLALAQAWATEVELLSMVEHPNIRKLLGLTVFNDEDGIPRSALVFVAPEGTSILLFEWLHETSEDESRALANSSTQLTIASGVCDGMAALASRGITFAILSSLSVEVVLSGGPHLLARLTRGGSSWWRWGWAKAFRDSDISGETNRNMQQTAEAVRAFAACPVNWMAPEVLRGDEPTEASDVYGFGALLWEIEHRAVPLSELTVAQIVGAIGYGKWRKHLKPTPPASTSARAAFLHDTVLTCSALDPSRRPTFAQLVEMCRQQLQQQQHALPVPPKLWQGMGNMLG